MSSAPDTRELPPDPRYSAPCSITLGLPVCSGVRRPKSLHMETLVVATGPRSTLDSCEYRTLLPRRSWRRSAGRGPSGDSRRQAGRSGGTPAVWVLLLAWSLPARFSVSAEGMEVAGRSGGDERLRRCPPNPRGGGQDVTLWSWGPRGRKQGH